MVVVAAGARGVARAAVETDPLGRRVGHVELRAGATRNECYGPRVEAYAVQRIRDGAHRTIKFSGSVRAFELRIRGHLDTQALLLALDERRLLSFVAARISRLPRAVGLVVGTTRGHNLAHAYATLGRDRFRVARTAPVRRTGRAATATASTAATAARRGRAGCPQQHGGEDNLVRCHRPRAPRARLLRGAAAPGKVAPCSPCGCPCYVGVLATPYGIDSTCMRASRPVSALRS